jgi:hypothetical protein
MPHFKLGDTGTGADGTEYPYARGDDGLWHRRPADDTWSTEPNEYSCSTVCGKQIISANVSASHPLAEGNYSYTEADVCRECEGVTAKPSEYGAEGDA